DVVSKLIVVNGSGDAGSSGDRVALPGIRIENGIADVFIGGSVEVLRAAFGCDADLAAGGPAILRSVIRGEYLNFLRGVHVGCADAGTVGAGANGGGAVVSDQTFRRARAVDIRWSLAEIETKVRKRAAARTGNQVGHENRVASVDLEGIDLLAGNKLLDRGGFGLQLHGRRGNFDG